MTARLARVHLNVADRGRASRFYANVLGFRASERGGRLVLTGGGGAEIVLHQVAAALVGPPLALGVGTLAFEVDGEALLGVRDRLQASGSRLTVTARADAVAIFTTDPDGNRLEVFSRFAGREPGLGEADPAAAGLVADHAPAE